MAKPPNYWKDFANLEREIQPVVAELGHFPTFRELYRMKRHDLNSAMTHHGGPDTVRMRLGYELPQKPKGYWQDWNNVERELNEVMTQLGHFPTQKELVQIGKGDLSAAIGKNYDGLEAVRDRFGIKKPVRLLRWTWDTTQKTLQDVAEEVGHFPSQEELIDRGFGGLVGTITKHFGGLVKVKSDLGYGVPSKGQWMEYAKVEQDVKAIIEQIGHFPQEADFKQLGKEALLRSICRHHKGIIAVRNKMGYQKQKTELPTCDIESEIRKIIDETGGYPSSSYLQRKEYSGLRATIKAKGGLKKVLKELDVTLPEKPKRWDDFAEVKQTLEQIITETGEFPTQQALTERKLYTLTKSLRKHGGLRAIKEKMGYESEVKPFGYWQDPANITRELQEVIDSIGHFPTQDELLELKCGSLINAIHEHYGGIPACRESFGYELNKKPNGYWQDFENVKKELEPIIEELGHFPTADDLKRMGRAGITSAILIHQNGLNAVREKMGYEVTSKPAGYWDSWENVEKELQPVIKELERFPSASDLKRLNKTALAGAITRHGGYYMLRDKMGCAQVQKPQGYWQNWTNVEQELNEVIAQLGHYPLVSEIYDLGRHGINHAIRKYHGGPAAVRERMGYGNYISSADELVAFLSEDSAARNLVTSAMARPTLQADIEEIIFSAYPDRFSTPQDLHELLKSGVTDLGGYLGTVPREERDIIPTFVGDAVENLAPERFTISIQERVLKLFRITYSPHFNENPLSTIEQIQQRAASARAPLSGIYKQLQKHYQDTLELAGVV